MCVCNCACKVRLAWIIRAVLAGLASWYDTGSDSYTSQQEFSAFNYNNTDGILLMSCITLFEGLYIASCKMKLILKYWSNLLPYFLNADTVGDLKPWKPGCWSVWAMDAAFHVFARWIHWAFDITFYILQWIVKCLCIYGLMKCIWTVEHWQLIYGDVLFHVAMGQEWCSNPHWPCD